MSNACQHTTTTAYEGETWTDSQGKPHTVIFAKCANPFCVRYGQVVHIRQTGDDTPSRWRMPPAPFGRMKP